MTHSEENYLKEIYHLSVNATKNVNTNSIANVMESKPSSVTDMVQKLAEKELVAYKKYQGVTLTDKGRASALMIIRKHRLWEVFLLEKLGFSWDEVHDVAEQLEHIKSTKLIDKLDEFLEYPKEDPHGDPIPDKEGNFYVQEKILLSKVHLNEKVILVGVKDSSKEFLQYLDKMALALGTSITMVQKEKFDNSVVIHTEFGEKVLSDKITSNLYVKKV
ncbi:metal-dependent transcriptional regulator [Flavobacterium kingsejongi]|uniref:Transcriptional regulator MntR n=1 Tax=Flavobacterium kingsejongi TaxID=1678728 RepID=A0A2S1LLU5_9FLAO|nr:metal-dependent transcriptional regulator [Flavobacterium kingsejongi]AWG24651.1 iron-dependent repressor [Flavobacterium kingsejongi]